MDGINRLLKPIDPSIHTTVFPKMDTGARRRPKTVVRPPPARPRTLPQCRYSRLVDKDGLFTCVVIHQEPPGSPVCVVESPGLQGAELVFKRIFNEVWTAIPWQDRGRLLTYWLNPLRWAFLSEQYRLLRYRPIIQIVNVGLAPYTEPDCTYRGQVLRFPALFIRERPVELLPVIARRLAEVYLHSTGEHWRLERELIEDPLDAWEREHGPDISDAELEAQELTASNRFLIEHEAATDRVLSRWGLGGDERGILEK